MELVYGRRPQGLQPREHETPLRDTEGAPAGRRTIARLIAPFALLVLSATFFCAIAVSMVARQADERQETERRAALQRAIDDIRSTGSTTLDPRRLQGLEHTWGLKDLRFEGEPAEHREVQSVIDGNGRIVGWFSWEADRPMTQALSRLGPLMVAIGLALVAFAAVAIWLVRRSTRELAASEQRAWKLAHEDALTGLPNRRKILELADKALKQRKADQVVTFAFLGLEGFKDINDALGHRGGDQLLGEVALRLRAVFPQSAVGRFGGDEFAIVMKGRDRDAAILVAEHAVAEIARPYCLLDQTVQIGASVGLAEAPRDGGSRDELTRRADLALRAAKRHSGLVVAFEPAIETEFNERRFLERELRRALTANALDVHYQPIVTADGTRVIGVEALARWTDASRGVIPPSVFIPVAEQTGLMGQLGEFVLRRALADAVRWPDISIAVNLSPTQVRDRGLLLMVSTMLHDAGIAPERIVLEVTESVLIDDPGDAKAQLGALRAFGVQIALDDFGTGYSSLSYLQQFPIDKLKIDRSFVEPLGRSQASRVMIQAMVGLGRALGHTVVAEGVETEEQRVLLRMAGCSEMQGHLFARPGPRETIDRLVVGEPEPQMTAANA